MSSAPKLRFGLWFDFRNPPQWRRPYEDIYAEAIEQVVWAESQGFEGAWLSEHHFAPDGYSPSPVVIAAALAVKTRRMRIGTNVLLLPLYHPVRLAEDCATVDILSRGRFELGVGLGYRVNEFEGYGVPYKERAGRTNEGLQIIRRLWEGETVTFHGKYYHVDGARLEPPPVQRPRPPIWVGGMMKPAAKRVARYGDGVIGAGVRGIYEASRMEMTELGKDPDRVRVAEGMLWLVVSNDPDKTWHELGGNLLHVFQDYAPGLEKAGMGKLMPYPKDVQELRSMRFVNIVTPEDAVRMIRDQTARMPVEHFCFMTVPPGLPATVMYPYLELFAQKVMPHFR
ncbi:MAG TPA: LLM class flavin-dependent oxidoreductase [Candidatus Binataceae bacterium]|nr:LLM class flavin-dependent oxidoreductase [Candidatus Binataceae bacterium]